MSEVRQWTIKGIPHRTVELARTTAKARGMKLGEFLTRALEYYAANDKVSELQVLDRFMSVAKKSPESRTVEEKALWGALKELLGDT